MPYPSQLATSLVEVGTPLTSTHAVLWQTLVHNSYHIGQVVILRRALGIWPPRGGGDSW